LHLSTFFSARSAAEPAITEESDKLLAMCVCVTVTSQAADLTQFPWYISYTIRTFIIIIIIIVIIIIITIIVIIIIIIIILLLLLLLLCYNTM